MTPQEVHEWLILLGKPTAGLIIFIILILYREAVIHTWNAVIDFIFKRSGK